MAMTTETRESMTAIRGAVTRLRGPQAPIVTSPLDRLQFMQRHFDEINSAARMGLKPPDIHLVQLAAHCVLWHMRNR
jgi:hypothetical protein